MLSFVDRLAEPGERPALIYPGRPAISYAELERRMSALAATFGMARKLIAVEASPSEHAVVSFLAALKGGHAVALLPPLDNEALDDFEMTFGPDIVCRTRDARWRITHGSGTSPCLHPDLALLLRTSGSTGKARFVRLSAQALNSNARSIGTYLGLTHADRGAMTLPFHYSYGLSVLNSHLAAGGSVYFPSNGAGDARFADEMRRAECTNISGVPHSYELFEKANFRGTSLPALRFMTVAGGRIAPDLAETYRQHLAGEGKRFFVMYGQTEATARIAYVPPEKLAGNTDSIGIAIPGGSLRIVGENGQSMKAGVAGELAYRGPNVMMGYADSRPDLARGHEVEELLTGDLATCDRNGLYRIVGRMKRISKIAGLRISHEAVEASLNRIGVAAAVVGDDLRLVAFVASDRHDNEILRAVMKASSLSALYIAVRRLDALPRLLSGKIDYAHLKTLMQKEEADADTDIVQSFRRAFYPSKVTLGDTFEQLGGDSLIFVQLSLVLDRKLGQAPAGWEKMPLGELARLVRSDDHMPAVDTELLVRATAITAVVVHHATLWPIPGGAAAMIMLVGFGLARFHSSGLFAGDVARLFRTLATNLAIYAPIVVGYAWALGQIPWASVFLVGNLGLVSPDQMLPYLYWFVEAYAQILLIFAGLFSMRPIRRFAARRPFLFGLALLAVTIPAKFLVPMIWDVGPARIFTVPDFLYLVALGWCIHFARTASDRLLLSALVVAVCLLMAWTGGNWTGAWVKYAAVLLAALALIYMPRIRVPRALAQLALPIAAASYHIYLFHRILPELFLPQPDVELSHPVAAAAAVVSGLLVGLAIYAAQRRAMLWLAQRRSDESSPFAALDASRV